LFIFFSAKLQYLPSQVTAQRSEPQERLQWFSRSDVPYGGNKRSLEGKDVW